MALHAVQQVGDTALVSSHDGRGEGVDVFKVDGGLLVPEQRVCLHCRLVGVQESQGDPDACGVSGWGKVPEVLARMAGGATSECWKMCLT